MSADNWAVCPKCETMREAQIREERATVEAAYGKVTVAEFDQMRDKYEVNAEAAPERTWREDYEIGLLGPTTDEFFISYSGRCTKCGFEHKYEHTKFLLEGLTS